MRLSRCIPFVVFLVTVVHIGHAADLWSLRTVQKAALPAVNDTAWPRTPVDRFILARLEQAGLQHSAPADRRTLIRRVTFDLTGLPPTPEEVMEFMQDTAPDAFARVVDRLLASPRYGERWGRHWLDVARYADTKGYSFMEHRHFAHAYTYRDYVIDAFNSDLPYDQFIREQIAADQLSNANRSALAALGFLTVGRRFSNGIYDIIDDRIDVVSRGLMALTVHCARCHDHKYDPIPTADYYSLFGVFASSVEPPSDRLPVLQEPPESEAYDEYRAELQKRRDQYYGYLREKRDDIVDQFRTHVDEYLLQILDLEQEPHAAIYLSFGPGEIRPQIVFRWYRYLKKAKAQGNPVFAVWQALRELPDEGFAEQAKSLLEEIATMPASEVNPIVASVLKENAPENMQDVARIYGKLLREHYERHRQRVANLYADGLEFGQLDAPQQEILATLLGPGTPTHVGIEESAELIDRPFMENIWEFRTALQGVDVEYLGGPPKALVLQDSKEPMTPQIFVRGDPNVRAERVPRQWLGLLANGKPRVFQHGSGRLELAQAIASRDNPLTARVLVNRIWLQHFGKAIVRTPDDFGTRSDPPTHPELLDYLAHTFMENGWSIKRVHREILRSSAYRQASTLDEAKRTRDPENRLVWRVNLRRLDWESLRDALLLVGGRINFHMGGRSVDILTEPFSGRRTVYAHINRQDLPTVFRMFDIANPDATTPQRHETLVPQQALYLMNSPFAIEQARKLARRSEIADKTDLADKVKAMYRLVFSRTPDELELEAGARYLESNSSEKMTATDKLAQVLLLTNEFMYIE